MLAEMQQPAEGQRGVLADSRLVYLFLYVNDLAVSRDFYERKLGLRPIEADSGAVKYDTGGIMLCLNRAGDYGITLEPGRHETVDIVFLVDDIDAIRAALESRGVELGPAFRYEPGGICDFYDPDGHWLTLYEPNAQAMAWPSGEKIRAVWRAYGRGDIALIGPAAVPERDPAEWRLDGKPLIYLFVFVRDAPEAQQFYNRDLGLIDLEGGPCSSGSGGDEEGVIKYDGGGIMLTTHRVWAQRAPEDMEHPCPPRLYDAKHTNALAMVFHVNDIEQMVTELARQGVGFEQGISRSQIGAIGKFTDPSGHVFYVYEPSGEALGWPSGPKIAQILAAQV